MTLLAVNYWPCGNGFYHQKIGSPFFEPSLRFQERVLGGKLVKLFTAAKYDERIAAKAETHSILILKEIKITRHPPGIVHVSV